MVGRAVGHSRSAAGDGLNLSDEDGGGAVEAGDDGAGDGRSRHNLADRGALTGLSRAGLKRDARSAGDLGGSSAGLASRNALSRSARRSDGSSRSAGNLGGDGGDAGGSGSRGGRGGLGSLGLGRDGALLGAAVERDGADDDTAARLGLLGLRRVDDGHVGSTTALLVHDVGAAL